MKVSVIGAGNVGAKAVYYIAEKNIADIVMVDVVNGLAGSKALDFLHAAPLRGYEVRIRGTTDFAEIEGSDVVVMTAGIARKPGMDRMDLLKTNVGIAAQAAREIALRAPNAVVIVVTNPLDVIAMVMLRETGFALRKVVGMAGVLDSTRFRWFIAEKLGVWPGDVQAMVLGGHGDEMVPLTRYTSVGGIPLDQLLDAPAIEALVKRTRTGGAEIVSLLKTGSAFYAPGASVAKMVEAVIKDERRLFPASAYLRGEYGYRDIYLGVPVVMGRNGVERIVELPLDDSEKKALDASAEAVRKGLAELATVDGRKGMKLHEYQAKGLLRDYGIPVPEGKTADTPEEAETIAREIGCPVMVKAQVLVGGRGKAGGVKMAADPKEAAARARDILGMTIKGIVVQRVLVARAVDIASEYYVSLTVDRASKAVQCIASASGGMEIEEIAVKEPHKIIRFALDPEMGLVREPHFDALAHAFARAGRRRAGLAHRGRDVPALQGKGLLAGGDQSLRPDSRGIPGGGGREGDLRRQRPVPAPRAGEPPQPRGVRRGRDGREGQRPVLRRPGRHHRVHRQRRRPLHGDDGPDQVLRRKPRELPGRRRQLEPREGAECPAHHLEESAGSPPSSSTSSAASRGATTSRAGSSWRGRRSRIPVPLTIRLIGTNEKEGRQLLEAAGIDAYTDLTEAVKAVVGKKGKVRA